jgi:hypothetical protein
MDIEIRDLPDKRWNGFVNRLVGRLDAITYIFNSIEEISMKTNTTTSVNSINYRKNLRLVWCLVSAFVGAAAIAIFVSIVDPRVSTHGFTPDCNSPSVGGTVDSGVSTDNNHINLDYDCVLKICGALRLLE